MMFSSCEVICLFFFLSTYEFVLICLSLGCLPVRSSSYEVVFLSGCLPYQTIPTKEQIAYIACISSYSAFLGGVGQCGGSQNKA